MDHESFVQLAREWENVGASTEDIKRRLRALGSAEILVDNDDAEAIDALYRAPDRVTFFRHWVRG